VLSKREPWLFTFSGAWKGTGSGRQAAKVPKEKKLKGESTWTWGITEGAFAEPGRARVLQKRKQGLEVEHWGERTQLSEAGLSRE